MSQNALSEAEETANRNLRRLYMLRNIAIVGQLVVIGVAVFFLNISLSLLPLLVIIASLAAWNIFTWLRLRTMRPVSDREFFLQMLPDVFALTGVLYFSGGATNPFAWIFLLPLIIAATILPKTYTWAMAGLTTACYSFLMKYYVALPYAHMDHGDGFGQHVFGMWFGFTLSAALIAYFISDMASTLRERDRILAEAREQALKDERLIALGTLAAGAAHELGTPLGTMAILVGELEKNYPIEEFQDLHEKLPILREQIKRCKETLSTISSSAGKRRAESGRLMMVNDYLEDAITRWKKLRPGIHLKHILDGESPVPSILADEVLNQALTSILNNAADASPEDIELSAQWDTEYLWLEVNDRGEGLNTNTRSMIGKDVFTTKKHGLGLGLFLAYASINRLGGEVKLMNRQGGGACTQVTIPLVATR